MTFAEHFSERSLGPQHNLKTCVKKGVKLAFLFVYSQDTHDSCYMTLVSPCDGPHTRQVLDQQAGPGHTQVVPVGPGWAVPCWCEPQTKPVCDLNKYVPRVRQQQLTHPFPPLFGWSWWQKESRPENQGDKAGDQTLPRKQVHITSATGATRFELQEFPTVGGLLAAAPSHTECGTDEVHAG